VRFRLIVSLVLLAVIVVGGAQSAAARTKPKPYKKLPMLSDRTCGSLLNRGSFENAISEETTVAGHVGASFSSTCLFLPPEEEGEDGHRGIGGGVVTLAVYDRVNYEFRGKERNLASFVPSPEGYFRSLRKAGEHAYAGYRLNTGNEEPDAVWGDVQVRNDVAIVAGEFPASTSDTPAFDLSWIDERLKVVAAELCPRCK
jgi:hypothetical protein